MNRFRLVDEILDNYGILPSELGEHPSLVKAVVEEVVAWTADQGASLNDTLPELICRIVGTSADS